MEDQNQLQSEPEMIEVAAETEISKEEEVKVMKEEYDNDEEFYEKIEAPKFVDFTKPYTLRTDDRYWFCSRVGIMSFQITPLFCIYILFNLLI